MSKTVTIVTGEPTVAPIAQMALIQEGVGEMVNWVSTHRPECLPWEPGEHPKTLEERVYALFPHGGIEEDGREPTDNELLVELAGRKCYDSFGLKAGKKSNAAYIANTQMHIDPIEKAADIAMGIVDDDGNVRHPHTVRDQIAGAIRDAQNAVPHASILYHAKMSFFIAGVSRRVSHELIRNYVGADRDEEGSPSQESTRYTEHYGFYVAHPYIMQRGIADMSGIRDDLNELAAFRMAMQRNYEEYLGYVQRQTEAATAGGKKLSTIERKRILESASPYLSHACETSWVWTTNPMALAKMFKERDNDGADLEFRRLAKTWKRVCVQRWPNLFPQPHMRDDR